MKKPCVVRKGLNGDIFIVFFEDINNKYEVMVFSKDKFYYQDYWTIEKTTEEFNIIDFILSSQYKDYLKYFKYLGFEIVPMKKIDEQLLIDKLYFYAKSV